MDIDYEALRRLQLFERSNASLTSLNEDFYANQLAALESKRASLASCYDGEAARICENALRIILEIIERRRQKIVLKALRAASGCEEKVEGLTLEERQLYTNLLDLLRRHVTSITALRDLSQGSQQTHQTLPKAESVAEQVAEPVTEKRAESVTEQRGKPRTLTIRLLRDLPPIVSSELRQIGPFAAKEVVKLPIEDAQLLIKRGFAEFVESVEAST